MGKSRWDESISVTEQFPFQNKDCEIAAIPDLFSFLDIKGSALTFDVVERPNGNMKRIMGIFSGL